MGVLAGDITQIISPVKVGQTWERNQNAKKKLKSTSAISVLAIESRADSAPRVQVERFYPHGRGRYRKTWIAFDVLLRDYTLKHEQETLDT